jgi:hypothetical protein
VASTTSLYCWCEGTMSKECGCNDTYDCYRCKDGGVVCASCEWACADFSDRGILECSDCYVRLTEQARLAAA